MSKVSTGGPAFPVVRDAQFPADSDAGRPKPGMSLRDYFASKAPVTLFDAMQAFGMGSDLMCEMQRINSGHDGQLLRKHAKLCYQWADAMMKAREGGAA